MVDDKIIRAVQEAEARIQAQQRSLGRRSEVLQSQRVLRSTTPQQRIEAQKNISSTSDVLKSQLSQIGESRKLIRQREITETAIQRINRALQRGSTAIRDTDSPELTAEIKRISKEINFGRIGEKNISARVEFVESAQAQGYSPQEITRAINTGTPLPTLPTSSENLPFLKPTIVDSTQTTRDFGISPLNILRASNVLQYSRTAKPLTKEEGLGLLFLPAFMYGAGARAVQTQTAKGRTKSISELFAEFGAELQASQGIKTAGSEASLREQTRKLIQQARNNPEQLKALEKFFKDSGRKDLFDDILAQEIIPESNILTRGTIDIPSSIETSGAITGQLSDIPQTRSSFEGKNLFERTDSVSPLTPTTQTNPFFRTPQRVSPREINVLGALPRLQTRQDFFLRQQTPQRTQQQLRTPQRSIVSLGLGLRTQQRTSQIPRTPQRNIPRLTQPTGTPTIPRPTRPGRPIIPLLPKSMSIKRQPKKTISRKKAYDVFIKKRGKFVKIADDLPIGKALKKGADITKTTLSAQFKIVRDKKATTTQKDIKFIPDKDIFRSYKIKKGKRVDLPFGQFIQRRGKRLSSFGELFEIKSYKRRKKK